MTVMRLRVDDWFGVSAIPAFDEDVDFNSSGVWITIQCPWGDWNAWLYLSDAPARIPAFVNDAPGHIIVVQAEKFMRSTKLLVKLKFFPPK